MIKLTAIQAVGYPVILALIYFWLGIADRSIWQVLLSFVLGLVIVAATAWLTGQALGMPLRRYLPWFAALVTVIGCAWWLNSYRPSVGLSIASHLTLWLRKPVKPETAGAVYTGLLWLLGTAGVLSLLPFAAGSRQALRDWRYWAMAAVLVLAGLTVPSLLVHWVPKLPGFAAQTASLAVRFILAYAIALAIWLALAKAPGRFRSA
jgi:hypothetical protein